MISYDVYNKLFLKMKLLMKYSLFGFVFYTYLCSVVGYSQWKPVHISDTMGYFHWVSGTGVSASIISSDTIFISAGLYRFSRSFDGGRSWNKDSVDESCGSRKMQFLNSKLGWQLDGRCISKTIDGGKHWSQIQVLPPNQTLPDDYEYTSLHFFDKLHGWIGCNYVGILATEDGGVTWAVQYIADVSNSRNYYFRINSMQFLDSLVGFAVGYQGLFLRTTNGGKTWLGTLNPDSIRSGPDLRSVSFPTLGKGFALSTYYGGGYYTSLDTSRSWELSYLDGSAKSMRLYDMYFTDAQNGWAVGIDSTYGVIYHTTNAGISWGREVFPELTAIRSISFIDSIIGIAVADNGWILRYTGGMTTVRQRKIYSLIDNVALYSDRRKIKLYLPRTSSRAKIRMLDILGRELYNTEIDCPGTEVELPFPKINSTVFVSVKIADERRTFKVLPQ